MTAPINYCGNETYPLNPTMMPTGPRTDDNSPSGVTLRSADAFTPDESGEFEQVQANWNQVDSSAVDYIKNKPTIPTVAQNTMVFKSFAGGVLTVTVDGVDK